MTNEIEHNCEGESSWPTDARIALIQSAREWLDRNDPLPRSELDNINSAFIRNAGPCINHPKVGKNEQMRVTTGEEAGEFAAEHDTVIYESKPQQPVGFGELMGLPVSDGWIPVLFCGPIRGDVAKEDSHDAFHHFDDLHKWFDEADVLSAVDRRAIPDGGQPIREDKSGSEMIEGDEIPETMRQRDEWFNFILTDESEADEEQKIGKDPVAPYNGDNLYPASWISNREEDRTDFETANKYTSFGREAVGRLKRHPDTHLAHYKIGLAYPIPKPEHRDPSESVTLIDLDDVRNPDDGALHPRAIELIEKANSFAQVSSSGTGIHILVIGALPDDVSTIDDSLPDHDAFPDAEIEVYDNGRFIAMTGDRVEGTPTEVHKRETLLADLADEFDADESNSEDYDYEPNFSKEHVSDVGTTDNYREQFAAARHATLKDINFDSEVTEKRASGVLSIDPSWEHSESGTRVAYTNDNNGPKFIYRKGDIGFGTPKFVALEERIISHPSQSLEGEKWFQTVEAMRERGANIPELDQTTGMLNQAAILPDIDHEDTDPTITQPEHWDLTSDTVGRAIEQEREVVIDAIMSSGKTYGALKAAYNRDKKIAFFSPRKDLYQQAKEYAIEIGYDESEIFIAPSINRDCPTYKGEHGERWKETLRKQYDLDASASDIHTHNDGIPCEGDDDDDERCNLRVKWNQLDHEQHKLVIGHYTHSHLPQLTKDRTPIFDEDTGSSFTNRIEGETLIRGINAFLDMDGSPPIDDFNELLEIRNDEMEKRRAMGWFNNHELGSESHKVIDNYEQGFHAKAPHAVYAILKAQPIEDGSDFERAYMPGVDNQARFFTTNEQKGEYYVELRDTPNLDYANGVIALDGTPLTIDSDKFSSEVPEWSNALGVNLDHEQVLNNDERADYIRNTLNNKFIVTTDAVKPYSSGTYANPVEDKALCHAVKEKYGNGTAPVAVSSKTVCEQYKSEGFIEDGVVSEFEHHGNLRGSNKHADTRLAAILGSVHHGDHEIARRAAWLGETIDPEGRGKDRDYGSEIGNKILENMREHQILQSILRFGRDGGGATTVINTSAYPDWIHIEGHGSIEPWSEGMRELVEAWQDLPDSGVTSSDVTEHDAVSKSDRRVRSLLEKAATDHGLLTRREGEGSNGAHLYADAGMSALEEEEMAEMEMPDLDDETMEDLGLVDEDGEPLAESVEISRYSLNTSYLRSAEGKPGESSGDDPVATDGGVAGGGDGPPRA